MKRADIQLVAFLGNPLKAPWKANWVRKNHQVRVVSRKGRSQTKSGLTSLGFVLHWDLLALEGTERSTQASASGSENQLCSTLVTKFCQGREDLADVAFF